MWGKYNRKLKQTSPIIILVSGSNFIFDPFGRERLSFSKAKSDHPNFFCKNQFSDFKADVLLYRTSALKSKFSASSPSSFLVFSLKIEPYSQNLGKSAFLGIFDVQESPTNRSKHSKNASFCSYLTVFKKVRAPSGSLSYPGRTTGADRLNYWLKISYICDKFVVELSKNALIQYLNASRSGSRIRERTKSHFEYTTAKENKQKIAGMLIPAHFEVRFSMKLLKFHVKIKREFFIFFKHFFRKKKRKSFVCIFGPEAACCEQNFFLVCKK